MRCLQVDFFKNLCIIGEKKGDDSMGYICGYFIAFYLVYSIIDIIVNADIIQDGLL